MQAIADLSLETTESEFQRYVERELADQIQTLLRRAVSPIKRNLGELVERRLKAQPEWESLVSGPLRVMLGLAQVIDPIAVLENILRMIKENIEVVVLPPAKETLGGLDIGILRSDFKDVLSVSGTSYTSISHKRMTETIVPWLEWLLFRGSDIVTLASIHMSRPSYPGSRTGKAIMYYPKDGGGAGWSVSQLEGAGTAQDNFLTRSLNGAVDEVVNIIISELR